MGMAKIGKAANSMIHPCCSLSFLIKIFIIGDNVFCVSSHKNYSISSNLHRVKFWSSSLKPVIILASMTICRFSGLYAIAQRGMNFQNKSHEVLFDIPSDVLDVFDLTDRWPDWRIWLFYWSFPWVTIQKSRYDDQLLLGFSMGLRISRQLMCLWNIYNFIRLTATPNNDRLFPYYSSWSHISYQRTYWAILWGAKIVQCQRLC